jgi:hypothetical protein
MDPVPDPLLLRKSGRAGTSQSIARNSDHYTEAVVLPHAIVHDPDSIVE